MTTQAVDELNALLGTGKPSHYVTEATRATVRQVTGLTLTPGDRWSRADIQTAVDALTEGDTLGPCGCVDYHMADCPTVTDRFGGYDDPPEPDDDYNPALYEED